MDSATEDRYQIPNGEYQQNQRGDRHTKERHILIIDSDSPWNYIVGNGSKSQYSYTQWDTFHRLAYSQTTAHLHTLKP